MNPTAKVPLEEIRDLEAQIEAKEGELPKLQTAKKALEARLRDEKEYTEATHTLKDIDAAIAKEEAELATARKEVSHIRTVHMTVTNYTG